MTGYLTCVTALPGNQNLSIKKEAPYKDATKMKQLKRKRYEGEAISATSTLVRKQVCLNKNASKVRN